MVAQEEQHSLRISPEEQEEEEERPPCSSEKHPAGRDSAGNGRDAADH